MKNNYLNVVKIIWIEKNHAVNAFFELFKYVVE